MSVAISKLEEILEELESINSAQGDRFNACIKRLKTIARKQFDNEYNYYEEIEDFERKANNSIFSIGTGDLGAIVEAMIDDIELDQSYDLNKPSRTSNSKDSIVSEILPKLNNNSKVFIVHGHNEGMKEATARFLEKMGLSAVILHEKANEGNTIIEKFTKHADVGFAIILLSADDYGFPKNVTAKNAKYRARQNVIFELGFFTGKIGRKRVAAIFEHIENFEKPSDIDGVIYIPYASNSKWQFDLAKELQEAGYQINLNKLI